MPLEAGFGEINITLDAAQDVVVDRSMRARGTLGVSCELGTEGDSKAAVTDAEQRPGFQTLKSSKAEKR
jgi:hypothetical protein